MSRQKLAVDASLPLDDPNRSTVVPYTAEEEAARDAEEAQIVTDKATKATQDLNNATNFNNLIIDLRAGTLDADAMILLADLLEKLT